MKYLMMGGMLLIAACADALPPVLFATEDAVVLNVYKNIHPALRRDEVAQAECGKYGKAAVFEREEDDPAAMLHFYVHYICVER